MSNIKSMSKKTGDATFSDPVQTLNDAIDEFSQGGALESHKKVLILSLDDSDGNFSVSFMQAGMKMSECISLCEVSKTIFLEQMEYLMSNHTR